MHEYCVFVSVILETIIGRKVSFEKAKRVSESWLLETVHDRRGVCKRANQMGLMSSYQNLYSGFQWLLPLPPPSYTVKQAVVIDLPHMHTQQEQPLD